MGVNILNTEKSPVINKDYIQGKVDKGEVFFISNTFSAVTNGASVYIRHKAGVHKYLNSILSIATVGQWEFTSFKGTTYSAIGTEIEPINRKSDSIIALETKFYHTPTITDLGTPRLQYTFGTGTNPAKSETSQNNDNYASVFAPNSDVLVRLTNNSGATAYITFIYNVYEEVIV